MSTEQAAATTVTPLQPTDAASRSTLQPLSRARTLKRALSRTRTTSVQPTKLRRTPSVSRRPTRTRSRAGQEREEEGALTLAELERLEAEERVMDAQEKRWAHEELAEWRLAASDQLRAAEAKLLKYSDIELGLQIEDPRTLLKLLDRKRVIDESTLLDLLEKGGLGSAQLPDFVLRRKFYEAVLDVLSNQDLLSTNSLELFRSLPVSHIRIRTPPSESLESALQLDGLLRTFAEPSSFHSLVKLDLSGVQVPQHALHYLHKLSLHHINLNKTNTSIEGIACLVSLAPTLLSLHLSSNPQVDDYCLPLIALFTSLESLDLTGTSTTQQGLHSFVVRAATALPGLQRIAAPDAVQEWVNLLGAEPPVKPSSITDPATVEDLSSGDLIKAYSEWKVKGYVRTNKERQAKLKTFLQSRADDSRCKQVMGEEAAAAARRW